MKEIGLVMKSETGELIYGVGRFSFVETDDPAKILAGWGVPEGNVMNGLPLLGCSIVAASVDLPLVYDE